MKKILILLASLVVSSILTWALCGYYLSELLHMIFPSMTHEQYTDYWFFAFVLIEVVVLSAVAFAVFKVKK